MNTNLYVLAIICAIGIASRGSYDKMQKEHENGNFHPYIEKHQIMALLGVLLSIGILVYTFIYFKWWYPIVMLVASGMIAGIFQIIISKIIGTSYSRLMLIWILPIIAIIYLITKLVL